MANEVKEKPKEIKKPDGQLRPRTKKKKEGGNK